MRATPKSVLPPKHTAKPLPAASPRASRLRIFGQAVRSLRNARGLTQQQLAEAASLHRTYIADIERGVRNVSLHNICQIAQALRLSVPELLLGL